MSSPPYGKSTLVNVKQLILVLPKRVFDPLHDRKYFLFLQPSTHNLDSDWQTVHGFSVVELICTLSYAVQLLIVEARWQLIQFFINMRYGQYAACVVKL